MDNRKIITTNFLKFLSERYGFDIEEESREYIKMGGSDTMLYAISKLSIDSIIYQVEEVEKIPFGSIRSPRKKEEYVIARQCVWDVLYKLNSVIFNYSYLGRSTLNTHATVKHGIARVKDMFETNDNKYISVHDRVSYIVDKEIDNIINPPSSTIKYYTSFYAKSSVNI